MARVTTRFLRFFHPIQSSCCSFVYLFYPVVNHLPNADVFVCLFVFLLSCSTAPHHCKRSTLAPMFSWEARPDSAKYVQRSCLHHQYSVNSTHPLSSIKGVLSDNGRVTKNVRDTTARVDTGRNRNTAVAYWTRRSSRRAAAQRDGSGTAGASPSPARAVTAGESPSPGGRIGPTEDHVVAVSPNWGSKANEALSSPPMTVACAVLPDGRTVSFPKPHQHLHVHFPTPQQSTPRASTSSFANDASRSPASPVSPVSRGPRSPTSTTPRSPEKRHNKAAATPADIFADCFSRVPRNVSSAADATTDESRLLRDYGYRQSETWSSRSL